MQKLRGILFLFFCLGIYVVQSKMASSFGFKEEKTLPFTLKEVSEVVGLRHIHQVDLLHENVKNVEPWINAAGASVAVSDINNDGFPDIYLCNQHRNVPNQLYINDQNGGFQERAKDFGLADVNSPFPCLRPLFFDYDSDGLKDLFLGTVAKPKLFRQLGSGQFIDMTIESGLGVDAVFAVAANILDFNKDGHIDIIVSGFFPFVDFYNPHTTKFMPDHLTSAKNGGATILYMNNGNGTFSNVTQGTTIDLQGWILSIGVYDLNYDSWPDLWFANDFGYNKVFLNNRDGTFRNVSNRLARQWATSGMSAEFVDLEGNKQPHVLVTQASSSRNQVVANQLWKFSSSGPITNEANKKSLAACGWSWGAKFIDLDNNGKEDLLVANGFISGDPQKSYWYHMDDVFSSPRSILSDSKNWPDLTGYSLSGYQKDCLFYNGPKGFTNIASQTELSNYALDGRGVAKIDYLNNGSLSFLVTNQKQKTLFFGTSQKNQNNWVGFTLFSKQGVPDVYGATIEISLEKKTFAKQSYYNNGFSSQSDARIHFGLGTEKEVKKATVRWPNGTTQRIKNIQINRYNKVIEE